MKASFSYEKENNYYGRKWPDRAKPYLHLEPYLRSWIDPGTIFKDKTVLEIGAGECEYTRLIAERYGPKRIIACELFRERMAPTVQANSHTNVHFVAGDCFLLPVRSGSCDVVWGSLVLHQLPDLSRAVAEISRVLKQNGLYVGFEPNPYNLGIVYRFLFKHHSLNQYLLTPGDLGAFRAAGFDLETTFFYAKVPWLHSRFLTTCMGIRANKVCA